MRRQYIPIVQENQGMGEVLLLTKTTFVAIIPRKFFENTSSHILGVRPACDALVCGNRRSTDAELLWKYFPCRRILNLLGFLQDLSSE